MQKIWFYSVVCCVALSASELDLGEVDIVETVESKVSKNVRNEEIKSADLGEALSKNFANTSLVRRSGIANDIIVRGHKKDNINVTIDGAKVCGACPNRMDPPLSHTLTHMIETVTLQEGPFNVEDFGSLGGDLKIITQKPSKDFKGEVVGNVGSWGYQKGSFALSGGGEKVRFLLSGSTEKGDQYKDGNGDDFVGQIAKAISEGKVAGGAQYQPKYEGLDGYEKKSLMGKVFFDFTDNTQLRLGYTMNRSDNILYPNTPMDAIYDDSDIFTVGYTAKALGKYSKQLDIELYQSTVKHPMSTMYRKAAAVNGFEMTHYLETKMQGAKLKNSFTHDNHEIVAGIDYTKRNWDGGYYKNGTPLPEAKFHSIHDVDTSNIGVFLKDTVTHNQWKFEGGLRFDDTAIKTPSTKFEDRDFDAISGYLMTSYEVDKSLRYFGGVGRSSRVPDAKELYFVQSSGQVAGNPTLDNVINHEVDIGFEKQFENFSIKPKLFYSKVNDFIAYNATQGHYENVDATLYGIDISGSYIATEALWFDYALAYQKGKKSDPLMGQVSTNLPEVPPLKALLSATYMPVESLKINGDIVATKGWSSIDVENGEQPIDGYIAVNLKATKSFSKGFELSVGVDNLFDTTYQTSNTYKDLTLLSIDGEDPMLLNEPGRYIYTQLKYQF